MAFSLISNHHLVHYIIVVSNYNDHTFIMLCWSRCELMRLNSYIRQIKWWKTKARVALVHVYFFHWYYSISCPFKNIYGESHGRLEKQMFKSPLVVILLRNLASYVWPIIRKLGGWPTCFSEFIYKHIFFQTCYWCYYPKGGNEVAQYSFIASLILIYRIHMINTTVMCGSGWMWWVS